MAIVFPPKNSTTGRQAFLGSIEAANEQDYLKRKEHIYSCKHPIMKACAELLMELDAAVHGDDVDHVQHLFMVSVNHATFKAVRKYRQDIMDQRPDDLADTDFTPISGFE
tara:strand:- start:31714 stop:32043 length:330 start_codon:yes stop_codon:yes gene_type:complete